MIPVVIIGQGVLHLKSLYSILVMEVTSKFESVLRMEHLCPIVPHQHLLQNAKEMFILVPLSY